MTCVCKFLDAGLNFVRVRLNFVVGWIGNFLVQRLAASVLDRGVVFNLNLYFAFTFDLEVNLTGLLVFDFVRELELIFNCHILPFKRGSGREGLAQQHQLGHR